MSLIVTPLAILVYIQPLENQPKVEECDELLLTSGYLCVCMCVNELCIHASHPLSLS